MKSDHGLLLECGSLVTADTNAARSSPELFTLRLASALGGLAPVWVSSTKISTPIVGDGFIVIPRSEVHEYVNVRHGTVLRMGYDPRLTIRTVRLARSLGWETAFYVFDHHSLATRGFRAPKRLAAEMWFRAGFWSLLLADKILVVNPKCVGHLPKLARNKLFSTRIGIEVHAVRRSIEREKGLFVYAGSLTHENLVLEMISAFKDLGDKDARLVIFGDGPLRAEVERLVEGTPRCQFAGLRPYEEVKRVQNAAWCSIALRCYSFPTSDFAFPSKLVESLASGAITISSPNNLVPDLPTISMQAEADTVEAISKALKKALSLSLSEHSTLTISARSSMQDGFNWEAIARDLLLHLT